MISVSNLCKSYKTSQKSDEYYEGLKGVFKIRKKVKKEAIKCIDFDIKGGEIVGYIGANGSGKSTTIKLLTGIIRPDYGRIQVNGMKPDKHDNNFCKSIGVLFGQKSQLWWDLPVIDSFKILSKVYGVSSLDYDSRLNYLVDALEIGDLLHTPVRKLSLGQRMICDLAAVFIHAPKTVFLDEPTIGLDVYAKKKLHSVIRTLNAKYGTTFIITSHDLYEIEALCTRVILIDGGTLVHDGSMNEFKRLNVEKSKIIHIEYNDAISTDMFASLDKIELLEYSFPDSSTIEIKLNSDDDIQQVISLCMKVGSVLDIKFKSSDINHIFVSYFSKNIV